MKQALGFIGLGVMGFPMAGHLSNKGYKVSVFNRSIKKSVDWSNKYVGNVCKTPSDIAKESKVIILCVTKDDDVRNIIFGESGIHENLNEETIIMDHRTTSADLPKEIIDSLIKDLELPYTSGVLARIYLDKESRFKNDCIIFDLEDIFV